MENCPQCRGPLHRSRRSWSEKFIYAEAFRCDSCDQRIRVPRRFIPLRYSTCPRCGSSDLSVLKNPDGIDDMNFNPFRHAQRLAGARLYHCWRCRVQFYDRRERLPRAGSKGNSTNKTVSA